MPAWRYCSGAKDVSWNTREGRPCSVVTVSKLCLSLPTFILVNGVIITDVPLMSTESPDSPPFGHRISVRHAMSGTVVEYDVLIRNTVHPSHWACRELAVGHSSDKSDDLAESAT